MNTLKQELIELFESRVACFQDRSIEGYAEDISKNYIKYLHTSVHDQTGNKEQLLCDLMILNTELSRIIQELYKEVTGRYSGKGCNFNENEKELINEA